MALRLTLENAAGQPAQETAGVDFGDRSSLIIGRAESADWHLPDPRRLLSGSHCEIRRTEAGYELIDLSTNGTFISGSKTRLPGPHLLINGDRLVLGDYLIRVDLSQDGSSAAVAPADTAADDAARRPMLHLAIKNERRNVSNQPLTASLGCEGRLKIGRDSGADWTLPDPTGGISREHCEIRFEDGAFVLHDTSANGTFVNNSGDRAEPAYRLKDGDELVIGAYQIGVKLLGMAVVVPPTPAEPPAPVAAGVRRGGDPAAMLAAVPTPASAPSGKRKAAKDSDGHTRIAPVAKAAPAAAPVAPAVVADVPKPLADGDALLAAMARGLGLNPADFERADPLTLVERMGQLLHLLTDDVRHLLAEREAALGLAQQSRPGTSACNPLTFMPTTEEALRVMFGPPRQPYLDGTQAFAVSLADLRRHSHETLGAIRGAVAVLSQDLSPDAIEQASGGDKGIGQLLTSRKARLWDAYVERWHRRPLLQPDKAVASFIQTFASQYPDAKS